MIILISSKIGRDSIVASLGKPEYSYYFLLREFVPALERLGTVIEVQSLEDIDHLHDSWVGRGERVVFLSFSPPQQTPLGLRCPTIPVFAWEFGNTPDQAWDGDPRNNWRHVFERVTAAVATSREAADAVRREMGSEFPVAAIPAPVWDRFSVYQAPGGWLPATAEHRFQFQGKLIDSPLLGLSADGLARKPVPVEELTAAPDSESEQPAPPQRMNAHERWLTTQALFKGWRREVLALWGVTPDLRENIIEPEPQPPIEDSPDTGEDELEAGAPLPPEEVLHDLCIQGVVYTSVLNPGDSRKNIIDLVTAFCWVFTHTPGATLILKMTHHDIESYRILMLTLLSRLAPFECRVLIIHGFLDDSQYRDLMALTTYYINTSTCEGLCLPLMEFLSAGKPALAPCHTAMQDYISPEIAFVLKSSHQPGSWPHDPTAMLATYLHRLDWESLVQAYRQSYDLAVGSPECYRSLSLAAHEALRRFASLEAVVSQLGEFLDQITLGRPIPETSRQGMAS